MVSRQIYNFHRHTNTESIPIANTMYLIFITLAFGLLCYIYRNRAIGSTTVDNSIKRFAGHLPIVGSLFTVLWNIEKRNDLLARELNKPKFSAVAIFIPFLPTVIAVNDPKSIEYILSENFDNYIKGPLLNENLFDLFGHGIFNSDGALWYKQRKIAARIFTTRAFRLAFNSVFSSNMVSLNYYLSDCARSQVTVDMFDLFKRFLLDTFGTIGFGTDFQSLTTSKDEQFINAFDTTQIAIAKRFLNPLWKLEEWIFPPEFEIVRKFGLSVVEDRRKTVDMNNTQSQFKDLLELYMENDSELTDDELTDHVLNFIIAARDSTAQALSWTIFNLSQHPHVLSKLRKEISALMGDELIPDYDKIKEMKYALAVFRETLRLYPSVPKESKIAISDDILPNGTPIASGTRIAWFPYAMGRNPNIWNNPMKFDPDRWIDGQLPTSFQYPVFNAGPRTCLGKTLAELQGVFVLVSIITKFDIEVLNPEQVTYSNSLTLPLKNGLKCTIKHCI